MTGIIVAIGNLIPELTTTILSCMRHGVKMTEFGVGCNLGGACFTMTVVPAVAFLINDIKSNSNELIYKQKEHKVGDISAFNTFFRDISFFLAALILYNVILAKGIIHANEALILLMFVVIYIFIIIKMNKTTEEQQREKPKILINLLNMSAREEHESLINPEKEEEEEVESHYLPSSKLSHT